MPLLPVSFRFLLSVLLAFAALWPALPAAAAPHGIYNPLHGYETEPTHDRFSRLRTAIESGDATLDSSGEIPLLLSLLRQLEVPVSSQMLVYSVTSLQKNLISPRRPRALYFNDDTYVGFVPGGQMEVISTDPRLGSIYYIFDRFRGNGAPRVRRTDECMNCHAPHHLDNIPGLVIESVVPGPTGGGERAFRRQQSGHGVPLDLRFGGWLVTGAGPTFPHHWGNMIIEYRDGQPVEEPIAPGQLFDFNRYPVQTSDVLPQLVQEHQVGFINRALQAGYRTRELWQGDPTPETAAAVDGMARTLVRYLLFADEVPLPPGSVPGDPAFKAAFLAERRPASNGAALKDFDLKTRLFRYRCSYEVYSPIFSGLPDPLKQAVYRLLDRVLAADPPDSDFAYLGEDERKVIRAILRETVADYPKNKVAGR